MSFIYKGDDTDAFGSHFIQVKEPTNLGDHTITKLIIECGSLKWTFNNPVFPFYIDPSASETAKFQHTNIVYMKAWDENGKCQTFEGNITFNANPQVVH